MTIKQFILCIGILYGIIFLDARSFIAGLKVYQLNSSAYRKREKGSREKDTRKIIEAKAPLSNDTSRKIFYQERYSVKKSAAPCGAQRSFQEPMR